jgi:hypothetical protein
METIAFVYKWTHIPSLKWYIGSRTAKGCNPNDGYICSSKIVKPMILNNPKEWKRDIIATGNSKDMLNFEIDILKLFDAKNDVRSFNRANCGPQGRLGVPLSIEAKQKLSETRKRKGCCKGIPKSPEHNLKNKLANLGRIHSAKSLELSRQTRLKNGTAKGEKNHRALVTEKLVIQLRNEYTNAPRGTRTLLLYRYMELTGLSFSGITCIVQKRSWKNI